MKTSFTHFCQILLVSLLLLGLGSTDLLAQSGIYVGGHFRRERSHTITDLKASGFTYVILFGITVEPNGDLTTDGETICANGTYVFGNTSPNYVADVRALKTGATSINRVEACVGGYTNRSYANIRSLVTSQGTGTGSVLYRNFRALKVALPTIDAINNDDEATYDVNSATAFHVMLADVGFKSTMAPYTNRGYWQSLVTNVNNQRSGAVDKIYLQQYEGGAGNNPCDWNLNNIELHTGDLYYENATTANNKMISARNNCRSKGGFFWVYNDNNINLKDLAGRVNSIYGITPGPRGVATLYQDCNYGGAAVTLPAGAYSLSALQSRGLLNDDVSSVRVSSGYEVVLYENDMSGGATLTLAADNACLTGNALGVGTWNDKTSSILVRPASAAFSRQLEAEAANVNNGMQVEACAEGGQDMGYVDAGDYLVWNGITFPTSGSYKIEYRMASGASGGTISADLDGGTTQLGNTSVGGTGGWQNWTTVSKTVNLNAGTYNFGLYAQSGGWNLNWVRISKVDSPAAAATTAAATLADAALADAALGIYPNPATDKLYLTPELARTGQHYRIVDARGRAVATGALTDSGPLNVTALPAGVYLLEVTAHDQRRVVRRFVK